MFLHVTQEFKMIQESNIHRKVHDYIIILCALFINSAFEMYLHLSCSYPPTPAPGWGTQWEGLSP